MSQRKDKLMQGYRVTCKKIGQGAFGNVFLGLNEEGDKVAVKVINRDSNGVRNISHIENEISALKSCKNEHIVEYFDIKKTSTSYYIFLEYCGDGDLKRYIKNRGRLQEQEALRLFYQIVKGFRTIVRKNIIHRDLKPENILLKDGKAKIADFGLSKIINKNNMAVTFAGSPLNVAPEILQGEVYDNRVDIYSLGTILYEMLFGVTPFSESNVNDLIKSIKAKRFKDFDSKLISKETFTLLMKLLKQNPSERITWEELFVSETKRSNKLNFAMISKYSGILSRVSPKNISAIASLFCILNIGNKENVQKKSNDDCSFLDLNLCSNLFMNLVKNTEIQQ